MAKISGVRNISSAQNHAYLTTFSLINVSFDYRLQYSEKGF